MQYFSYMSKMVVPLLEIMLTTSIFKPKEGTKERGQRLKDIYSEIKTFYDMAMQCKPKLIREGFFFINEAYTTARWFKHLIRTDEVQAVVRALKISFNQDSFKLQKNAVKTCGREFLLLCSEGHDNYSGSLRFLRLPLNKTLWSPWQKQLYLTEQFRNEDLKRAIMSARKAQSKLNKGENEDQFNILAETTSLSGCIVFLYQSEREVYRKQFKCISDDNVKRKIYSDYGVKLTHTSKVSNALPLSLNKSTDSNGPGESNKGYQQLCVKKERRKRDRKLSLKKEEDKCNKTTTSSNLSSSSSTSTLSVSMEDKRPTPTLSLKEVHNYEYSSKIGRAQTDRSHVASSSESSSNKYADGGQYKPMTIIMEENCEAPPAMVKRARSAPLKRLGRKCLPSTTSNKTKYSKTDDDLGRPLVRTHITPSSTNDVHQLTPRITQGLALNHRKSMELSKVLVIQPSYCKESSIQSFSTSMSVNSYKSKLKKMNKNKK